MISRLEQYFGTFYILVENKFQGMSVPLRAAFSGKQTARRRLSQPYGFLWHVISLPNQIIMTLLSITGWCSTHGSQSLRPPYPCQEKSVRLTKQFRDCLLSHISPLLCLCDYSQNQSFFAFSAAVRVKLKCYSDRQGGAQLICRYCLCCTMHYAFTAKCEKYLAKFPKYFKSCS